MSRMSLESIRITTAAESTPRAFVYEIRHIETGKRYIGSTARWPARRNEHLRALRAGKHHSVLLQRAWNKYGEGAFECELVAKLFAMHAPTELQETEQDWMRMTQSSDPRFGYNIAPVAGSCLGVKHSEQARANYSAAAKRRPITPEMRAKMAATKRGKPCSEATKEKIRQTLLGRRRPNELKEQQRQTMLERKHKATEAKRARMRAIAAARPPEYYTAMREGLRRSREHRNQLTIPLDLE
jgi:group I intron endonuclease